MDEGIRLAIALIVGFVVLIAGFSILHRKKSLSNRKNKNSKTVERKRIVGKLFKERCDSNLEDPVVFGVKKNKITGWYRYRIGNRTYIKKVVFEFRNSLRVKIPKTFVTYYDPRNPSGLTRQENVNFKRKKAVRQ